MDQSTEVKAGAEIKPLVTLHMLLQNQESKRPLTVWQQERCASLKYHSYVKCAN